LAQPGVPTATSRLLATCDSPLFLWPYHSIDERQGGYEDGQVNS